MDNATATQKKTISDIDDRLRLAMRQQQRLHTDLDEMSSALMTQEQDEESLMSVHRLVLQYRLDQQNVIKGLLKLHRNLCLALGIDPLASHATNLNRAADALGHGDVQHELALLQHLSSKLEHALSLSEKSKRQQLREKQLLARLMRKFKRYLNNRSTSSDDLTIENDYDTVDLKDSPRQQRKREASPHAMKHAIELQANFSYSIEQLTESIQVYAGSPKFGIIYDYLAGLKGPISRFHLAEQSGIAKTTALLNQLSNALGLDKKTLAYSNQRAIAAMNRQLTHNYHLQQQLIKDRSAQLKQLAQLEQLLDAKMHNKVSPTPAKEPLEVANKLRRTLNFLRN